MNSATKAIINTITGLFLGVAVLFLAIVCVVGFAFATTGSAALPGVFEAWVGSENDMPALSFAPNGIGMLVFVLLIAGVYAIAMQRVLTRKRGSTHA